MGRKHRPKITKIFIPPREIDFIKKDIPIGHCLLCEAWIGVNGHEHHQHQPPTAETAKDIPPAKVFPKMAETPHIIISPDAADNEPEFPTIDEEDGITSAAEETDKQENHVQDSPEVKHSPPTVQIEEKNESPKLPDDSPPPAYESTPSSQQSPVTETPLPLESTSFFKGDLDRRQSLDSENFPVKGKDPLRRCSSEVLISNEDMNPPIDAYDMAPIDRQLEEGRFEQIRPVQFHSHSMGHSIGGSLVHSLKNDSSNLDPMELLQRKTRRHSMIDMMRRASSQSNIGASPLFLSPEVRKSISRTSLVTSVPNIGGRSEGVESMILCVSALYGKLLVVMGMAFPVAEVISADVPLVFYNTFYLYLYFGSIIFLLYAYLFLLRSKALPSVNIKERIKSIKKSVSNLDAHSTAIPMSETARRLLPRKNLTDKNKSDKFDRISMTNSMHKAPKYTITETSNHGSMYLKMGAVLFGVGSMIYSGLEFGQYFELRRDSECGNVLMAITPVARMIFTFLQMYFIFLNSRVAINKHTIIARFGLMHMIGTNMCIWLNVLVQETEHEIVHLTNRSIHKGHVSANLSHSDNNYPSAASAVLNMTDHDPHLTLAHDSTTPTHGLIHNADDLHNIVKRMTEVGHFFDCRRINIMGQLVNSASPFLFPCTIEYSLLCAGVLYVMWKNINVMKTDKTMTDADSDISNFIARKLRHHYSVDCAKASRGLFMGIFVLVLTIISLILFYVLITNEEFKDVAILEANIIELSIYSLSLISVVLGMKQMRELEFHPEGDIELDNILLLIAQAGVYIYTSFTIIGDYFSLEHSPILSLSTAIITLIQTTIQTLFILDGSRRCCYTAEQHERKPGREMVTFLLVCNLALWAISTFETSRADVHPTQLHFYGIWAWTIISHVSMPLAIFYRFHVTVCLGEIWKRSYKMKQDTISLGVDSFR